MHWVEGVDCTRSAERSRRTEPENALRRRVRRQREAPIGSARGSTSIGAAAPLDREPIEGEALGDELPLQFRLVSHAANHIVEGLGIDRVIGPVDMQEHPRVPARADDPDRLAAAGE